MSAIFTKASQAVRPFLNALFPEPSQSGFLEVRVFDENGHRCHERRWYTNTDEVARDHESLVETSNSLKACVALAPGLRRTRDGKKASVKGAWCLWVDLDPHQRTQEECLRCLIEDELDWLVVDSGYGAHGYVLLSEFCDDIGVLERLNGLLKQRLGGDHVQDAGRVMRLVETVNWKDPDDPRTCSVIQISQTRYRIDELLAVLEESDKQSVPSGQVNLLSVEAQEAARHDSLLQRLEAGTLAMVFDEQATGWRSEHDLAVANRLVATGFTDPEIKAVFARYPVGGKAREAGLDRYLDLTLSKARSNGHRFLPQAPSAPTTPAELQQRIAEIRGSEKTAPARQEATARVVTEFFDRYGQFFTDGAATGYLHYRRGTYALADNRLLRALLQDVAGLSLENKDGKLAVDRLANHALLHGQPTTTRGPVFADRKKHRIYVSTGSSDGRIVVVSPGRVCTVPNGTNEDRICLTAPPELAAFEFEPDVDIAAALELYRSKCIDLLPCDDVDRLTLTLWLLNVFLLDYSTVKIVTKFSGPQASGKTVACRLLGLLVAGTDVVKVRPTAPALYADPMPLQILDNVENRDLRRALEDMLLFSATGGSREKLRLNTDDERVRKEVNCLLLLNGIESLDKSELLSRVYEIQCGRQHQCSGFVETEVIDELLGARDTILSGVLRMLADHVLPRIAEGGIRDWKSFLDANYADHPKARSFEFLARMGLIAEGLRRYQGSDISPAALTVAAQQDIAAILERQAQHAGETDAETNVLGTLLHALANERRNWDTSSGSFASQYHIDFAVSQHETEIVATARELFFALSALGRHAGLRGLEVRSPRSLGSRLLSDKNALLQSGIEVEVVDKRNNMNVYRILIDQ